VREVAGHAGISTGTLLHHFDSKASLLTATLIDVSEDFHTHAKEVILQTEDPVDQLRRLVRAVLESPRHDVGWRVWMAFWHEAALNPQLSPAAIRRNELWEEIITAVIEEGQKQGRLAVSDPAEAASELAALINGVAVQRYAESARWSPSRAVSVVERLIDQWSIGSHAQN
jgi:AcrR family transcriptional regulator